MVSKEKKVTEINYGMKTSDKVLVICVMFAACITILLAVVLNSKADVEMHCQGNIEGDARFDHKVIESNETYAFSNTTITIHKPLFDKMQINKINADCDIKVSGNLIAITALAGLGD